MDNTTLTSQSLLPFGLYSHSGTVLGQTASDCVCTTDLYGSSFISASRYNPEYMIKVTRCIVYDYVAYLSYTPVLVIKEFSAEYTSIEKARQSLSYE